MREVVISFIVLLASFIGSNAYSQVIVNGYAEVTGISGTTLTVGSVDQSDDTFQDGEQAIIMQMQDDVIGANTANTSNFGDLDNIQSAGLYEVVTISDVSGMPGTLVINGPLTNTYNTGPNSSVQIITYPTLDGGGGDYTTT